ncbi:MAG: hypothetical protein QOE77_728 [Blastocatellia bacterium]|jgi:hypothetical protein|nr:hypothetical protein [Blastocatellia bacterium]
MKKTLAYRVAVLPLIIVLAIVPVFADTIRLKDGSVLRGQVVGFKDQQFTILIGSSARGRRSRVMVYMEDVESIEFDAAGGVASGGQANDDVISNSNSSEPVTQPSRPISQPPVNSQIPANTSRTNNPQQFFQVNVRVRGDNAGNGWTHSGLVVRRGQRLRISATGRITLGGGRFATPEGVPGLPDRDKLMRNQPTGGLIAVIGDDNDDFIFIGANRDFVAQRDGALFLGVNEGNLGDNTGVYDAIIEAEALNAPQL